MTQRPAWGRIAAYSLVSTVAIAVVLFFALSDDRWIAGAVLGLGVIEAAFLALVLPRLTGAEEATPIRDGDWGVPPPSESAEPAPDEDA